jgi:hypothetical protein
MKPGEGLAQFLSEEEKLGWGKIGALRQHLEWSEVFDQDRRKEDLL